MTSELNVVEAKEVPSTFQLAYKKTKYEIDTAEPDTVVVSDQHRQAEVLDKYYLLEEPSSIAKLIDVHNTLAKKEKELSQRVEGLSEKREEIRAEIASFDAQLQASADGPVSADELLSVGMEMEAKRDELQALDKQLKNLNRQKERKRLHQKILRKILAEILQNTSGKLNPEPEELQELTQIARIQNTGLVKALLGYFVDAKVFSNPHQMKALHSVLLILSEEFYAENIDALLSIARQLADQLNNRHKGKQSYHDTVDLMDTLRVTWLVLSLAGVDRVDEEQWQTQSALIREWEKDPYFPLQYRASLLQQSMQLIRTSTPAWKKNCLRGYRILSGIALVASGVVNLDLQIAEEGATRVFVGLQVDKASKKTWYTHIAELESVLALAMKSQENFNIFMGHAAGVIAAMRETNLSYGVFELAQRIALRRSVDAAVRTRAVEVLAEMYREKEKWHADVRPGRHGKGNGDENLREQVLETLLVLAKERSPIGAKAKQELIELYKHFATKDAKGVGFEILNQRIPGADIESAVSNGALQKAYDSLNEDQGVHHYLFHAYISELPSLSAAPNLQAGEAVTGDQAAGPKMPIAEEKRPEPAPQSRSSANSKSAMFQPRKDSLTVAASGSKIKGGVKNIHEDISGGALQYPEGMAPSDVAVMNDMADRSVDRIARLMRIPRPPMDVTVIAPGAEIEGGVENIDRRYRGNDISVVPRSGAGEQRPAEPDGGESLVKKL